MFALLEAGDRWSEWAGVLCPQSSWAVPGDPPGTVGAVRKLGLGPIASLERITEHVPGKRLGYEVASWQPYRDYRSAVDLIPTTDGGTRIVWQSTFEVSVPGTGALLRFMLHKAVAGFARNLARAAETAG